MADDLLKRFHLVFRWEGIHPRIFMKFACDKRPDKKRQTPIIAKYTRIATDPS